MRALISTALLAAIGSGSFAGVVGCGDDHWHDHDRDRDRDWRPARYEDRHDDFHRGDGWDSNRAYERHDYY